MPAGKCLCGFARQAVVVTGGWFNMVSMAKLPVAEQACGPGGLGKFTISKVPSGLLMALSLTPWARSMAL